MLRPFRSPWLCAGVLTLVLTASAFAQPPVSPTGGATPPTGAGATTPAGSTGAMGFSGLFGGFGVSLFSSAQDAEFLTTAMTIVQEISQVIPLSTEEETILVFFIYEIEKINAIMSMFSSGGTTPSPGGP